MNTSESWQVKNHLADERGRQLAGAFLIQSIKMRHLSRAPTRPRRRDSYETGAELAARKCSSSRSWCDLSSAPTTSSNRPPLAVSPLTEAGFGRPSRDMISH